MEMGISSQLNHPKVVAAYETTISACKKHGKHVGMGGIYSLDLIEKFINMGVRMILGSSDLSLMISAGKEQTTKLHSMLENK
jgi:2-keto-3-deoxy-L-rhamnonate aldolase RhmA